MYGGPQQTAFVDTIVGLTGINHFKDLNGGTPNCVSITPLVCDAVQPISYTVIIVKLTHLSSYRRLTGTTLTIVPLQLQRIYPPSKLSAQIG